MLVPLVGNGPLHPPDATQELAFDVLHISVTDAPIATLLSLDFRITNGGAATTGVSAMSDVCAFELAPHAASELSAANPSIDFNAYADLVQRLRRIEAITRLPRFTRH
jgi:hypothetical protein